MSVRGGVGHIDGVCKLDMLELADMDLERDIHLSEVKRKKKDHDVPRTMLIDNGSGSSKGEVHNSSSGSTRGLVMVATEGAT